MSRRDGRESGTSHLPTVLLCGPITGISPAKAGEWRRKVARALDGDAHVIDPTRDVIETRRRSACSAGQPSTAERLLHGKRTVARDQFDVRRADLVLACFLGAKSVSIGAVGEIFWANAF